MVHIKTNQELAIIKEAGRRLRRVVDALIPTVTAHMTTQDIDKKAQELIVQNEGYPGFKKVPNYDWATCLSINEQAVHTPPSKRIIKEEDVLTIDIGLYYKGFHTDYATTFIVGRTKDPKIQNFLNVGKQTLSKAIQKAKNGNFIGEISKTIEDSIYSHGYFILKELTGHGIGRNLHEDPMIPGFLDRPIEKTYKLRGGMACAIEVIYSMGTEKTIHESDNSWSIATSDRSLSACFENTIAIYENRTEILT